MAATGEQEVPEEAAGMTGGTEQDRLGPSLLGASREGNLLEVNKLLDEGAPAYYQEEEGGTSPLMHAAAGGHVEIVQQLLSAGAPWNALDRQGRCAGEYAMEASHQAVIDVLVDHAVLAEMLLGAAEAHETSESDQYLSGRVRYEEGRLVDEHQEGVMMQWETPLMEAHAGLLCGDNGDKDVLNVGFGMGIFDRAIQAKGCRSHTIIEAHPEVIARAEADGWKQKPGVTLLVGKWQDVMPALAEGGPRFDVVFFDTYAEHYRDMQAFHEWLPRILRPGGQYSFFNGLAPDNIFFHAVACQMVKLELEAMGFAVEYATVQLEGGASDDDTWEGLRRRYWHGRDEYYLPIARLVGAEAQEGVAMDTEDDGAAAADTGVCEDAGLGENATADDTLLAEAQAEDGSVRQVLLRPMLDPGAGGLQWLPVEPLSHTPVDAETDTKPLEGEEAIDGNRDPLTLLQLRTWYPPMLNDARRARIFESAITTAIDAIVCTHKRAPTVLDIGTGTGLLAVVAAKAGAAKVIACDSFPALADIARTTVKRNGLQGVISVKGCRSTSFGTGTYPLSDGDRPDIIISELLHSTLLGEGFLSSVRDIRARGLVSSQWSSRPILVPARARVMGQFVRCDHVRDLVTLPPHFLRSGPAKMDVDDDVCVGWCKPIPLYLQPHTADRSDGVAAGPVPYTPLSDAFTLLDIDFLKASDPSVEGGGTGPVSFGTLQTVNVNDPTNVHGVLIWWELEAWPGGPVYSTAPTEEFQDHWQPCVFALPSNTLSTQGSDKSVVQVQAAHDDTSIWLHVHTNTPHTGVSPSSQSVLSDGPKPCTCGMHQREGEPQSGVPPLRVLTLNDTSRREALGRGLEIAVSSGMTVGVSGHTAAGGETASGVVLDLCDGCEAGLVAHRAGHRVVSLVGCSWWADVVRAMAASSDNETKAGEIVVWEGAGRGQPWQEEWGHVTCVVGDGYYQSIGLNRPVWSWLNFWLLRTAIDPILARGAAVMPFQARVMAAVVECEDLFNAHAEVGDVLGTDQSSWRAAWSCAKDRAPSDEDKDLPITLSDHRHKLLTPPATIMRFELHKPIDFDQAACTDGLYKRTAIAVPVERSGRAHAVAVWVDADVTFEAAALGSMSSQDVLRGYGTRYSRQRLRWLDGREVAPGHDFLSASAALDVVNPGVWCDFSLTQDAHVCVRETEEEDDRC